MKYLIFFLSTFFLKANGQDLLRQLQRQMWYVQGDIYKGDTCSIHIDKPENCTGYLVFGKDEIEMHMLPTENKFVCNCEILNDKIKLFYTIRYKNSTETNDVKIYYKTSSVGRDFALTPIPSSDFK